MPSSKPSPPKTMHTTPHRFLRLYVLFTSLVAFYGYFLYITRADAAVAQYTNPTEYTHLAARSASPWVLTSTIIRFMAFWHWNTERGKGWYDAATVTLCVTVYHWGLEWAVFEGLKTSALVISWGIDLTAVIWLLGARGDMMAV